MKRQIICLLCLVMMVSVVSADTLILYIDDTAQDGRLSKTCSGAGSWATCRDAAASNTVTTTTGNTNGPLIDVIVAPSPPNFSEMRRGVFIFNTSKVGAGQTVSSAVLSIAQNSKTNTFPVSWAIGVTTFTPAAFTSLSTADYGKSSYLRVANDIPYDSIVNAGYNNWSLTNLSVINITGFTPLMTDINWSIDNTPPELSGNAYYARFYMYDTSQSGTSLDPFMTIIYSAAGGDTTPPASITSFSQNKNTCTEQTITWTNPVDADFASVMVYQDNVWHVNETGTSHAFTGLNSWQSYVYSTKTQDATGNINATWVNQTIVASPICKIITYIRQFYLLEGVI